MINRPYDGLQPASVRRFDCATRDERTRERKCVCAARARLAEQRALREKWTPDSSLERGCHAQLRRDALRLRDVGERETSDYHPLLQFVRANFRDDSLDERGHFNISAFQFDVEQAGTRGYGRKDLRERRNGFALVVGDSTRGEAAVEPSAD